MVPDYRIGLCAGTGSGPHVLGGSLFRHGQGVLWPGRSGAALRVRGVGAGPAVSAEREGLRAIVCILLGVWAINAYASFWIARSSTRTLLSRARPLVDTQGRHREVARLLQAGLEREPQNAELRSLLARVLSETGDLVEATRQAQTAVRDQPDDPDARLVLATLLTRQERIAEATDHARRAVELAPGLAPAYQQLAALLARQRRYDEAVPVSRDGLALAPFNAEMRFTLGNVLVQQGRNEEAVLPVGGSRAPQALLCRRHQQAGLAAGHLSTSRASRRRQGRQAGPQGGAALRRQEFAVSGHLAAACAEAGQFPEAVDVAGRALALAVAENRPDAAEIRARLKRYQGGSPYREPQ